MAGRDPAQSPAISGETRVEDPGGAPQVLTFAAIYREYFDFVWSSARRLGVSSAAIDDVVQEIFIVIHSKLNTLQRPSSLRSWIYGIVRRTASTYRRAERIRNAPSALAEGESRESMQPTPLDLTVAADERELLFRLLADLDEVKREVFILVELEEMTVPDVAQSIEVPLNTVYSRLRAARHAFELALARQAARSGKGRE